MSHDPSHPIPMSHMSSRPSLPPQLDPFAEAEEYSSDLRRTDTTTSTRTGYTSDGRKTPTQTSSELRHRRSFSNPTNNPAPSVKSYAAKSTKSARSRLTTRTNGTTTTRKAFQSTRLKGEIYKPWLEHKDPAQRWARWITLGSIVLGLIVSAVICYDGYRAVPNVGKLCLVLDDDFSKGFDTSVWEQEVRLDGYGNGEFEWTTASSNNTFVEDGILYLVPTLTSDILTTDQINSGYTLNLTADGTCTSTNVTQCVAASNSSLIQIINPVRSARITTRKSVGIKYGKVEVKARMPTGDWLWPAIWMLPKDNVYGSWPRSGEIDIVESRGNNASYGFRGQDYIASALHWGPTPDLDRYYLSSAWTNLRRATFADKFHTFGLEWNSEFMWTYVDSRVSQVISLRFAKESFWTKGQFPSTITNASNVIKLQNPWALSDSHVAPFDQEFYLVMNLAVGGTNGWFPDGIGGKPWIDSGGTAMSDFWAAKDKWWPTWPADPKKRGLAVESVKMWQKC